MTPQERAAAVLDQMVVNVLPRDARDYNEQVIENALRHARRAALEEASKLVRARGDEYMNDCQAKDATGKKYRDTYEMRRVNSGRAWAFKDLADELDRLREGG